MSCQFYHHSQLFAAVCGPGEVVRTSNLLLLFFCWKLLNSSRTVHNFTMDTEDDGKVACEDVPPALLKLAERVETLQQVVQVFRGWDEDVAEVKGQTIVTLSSCKKNIKEIASLFEALGKEFTISTETANYAKYLESRMQFVLRNIPEHFNCPPPIKPKENDVQPTSLQKNASVVPSRTINEQTGSATSSSSTNYVPEVLYLSLDEFEKVPKYLKGRVSYTKINSFIDLFNKVLNQKYAVFKKKRTTLKKKDADLWVEYSRQEIKETKGLFFCVANDFKTLAGTVLDKASLNMLTILRHCGRIREVRTGGLLRYVAMY